MNLKTTCILVTTGLLLAGCKPAPDPRIAKLEARVKNLEEKQALMVQGDDGILKIFQSLQVLETNQMLRLNDLDRQMDLCLETLTTHSKTLKTLLENKTPQPVKPISVATRPVGSAMLIYGKVLQRLDDGLLVDTLSAHDALVNSIERGQNTDNDPTSLAYIKAERERKVQPFFGLCLLINHPLQSNFVDDSAVSAVAIPVGEYQYVSTTGAQKTIRKFSVIK